MKLRIGFVVAVLPVFLTGCSTVSSAREAQRALKPKSVGIGANGARVVLRDARLETLVAFALTNRPSVVSARLAVEDAHLAMKALAADAPLVSKTPWLSPHLSFGGSYNAVSDAQSTRIGWATEGSAASLLSLDLLIWDFGRNAAKTAAAAENVIAAERQLVAEGYSVFEDVASAYFAVLEADSLLEVARTNEYEFAEHLRQAKDKLEAGEAQRLDVTRAKLDLSQARENTVSASNLVVTSGAELMRALGIDAERGSREDVLPIGREPLGTVRRGFARSDESVDAAFAFARTNAPSVAISRAKLRAAMASVDSAVADLLPSISASASLNWTDPLWLWKWGFSATQSLFTGFRKTTQVEQAVVSMKTAAADVDESEQQLSLSLELAIAERDNAGEALRSAHASVISASENYDTVKEQYREGDASRIDFTDAVSDYATALGSSIKAFYRGQIAEAKLFALTGRLPVYREEKVSELK